MHMFLRFRNEDGVNQVRTNRGRTEALETLGERLNEEPRRLRWTPAHRLCEAHDRETLGFGWEDVEAAWRASNVLPDEGTDDLAGACPHEAVEDERCLFHLRPGAKDDERVRDALVEAIQSGEPARRSFDGARFGTLDLSDRELSGAVNDPIDLRFAVVEGEFDMSGATVPESMFSMRFATVHGDASFREARFGETATFVGAGFRQNVSFYRTAFDSKARFTRARFGGTAVGSVGGSTDSRRYATFAKATFDRSANFHGAWFDATGNFDEVTVTGPATFVDTEFHDDVHLRAARFADVRIAPDSTAVPLGMERTELGGGHLDLTDTRVDLTDGTLGAVELVGDDEPTPRLDRIRLLGTEFDGFEFANHRDAFGAVSWRIHGYDRDGSARATLGRWLGLWTDERERATGLAPIESTYLHAKRSATAAGDSRAAGEFFRREMAYRRLGHGYRLRSLPNPAGWRGLWRWLGNTTMGLTTGYGERPSRVFLSSGVLCLGFAGLFAFVLAPNPEAVPFSEFLLFSFQSFISFVVGTPQVPGTESFGLRAASAAEGFLGAFFVALFVFTLTRSVHR